MVYLAGCIGNDDQGKIVEGTIQDRTRRALFNAERRLRSVGLDLSDGMFLSTVLALPNVTYQLPLQSSV
jgi:enamine deaminase RidA (YjgF/YER057c/UK114 family)